MNLIPVPREITYLEEKFKLKRETTIILDYNCSFDNLYNCIASIKQGVLV